MCIPKPDDWINSDGLTLLRGWARDGLTNAQIAERIGISSRTLDRWKNYEVNGTYPIRQALKSGKEVVDYAVESALLKKAMEGDTTAMIFWLKNRQPDRWRERRNEPDKIDISLSQKPKIIYHAPDNGRGTHAGND